MNFHRPPEDWASSTEETGGIGSELRGGTQSIRFRPSRPFSAVKRRQISETGGAEAKSGRRTMRQGEPFRPTPVKLMGENSGVARYLTEQRRQIRRGVQMYLFWRIRYLDRKDRTFKNRDLFLETNGLEPAEKAAVELIAEARTEREKRQILKFRSRFFEGDLTQRIERSGFGRGFCLTGYFEDDEGNEITNDEIARLVTGSPTARAIPSGAEQHDIDYMFAEPKPVPIKSVNLSPEAIAVLGTFVRDVRELSESAFMKDGPGSIHSGGSLPPGEVVLETPCTDEEIRSFVTIFRRLYMEKEPANFLKAAEQFSAALGDQPLGNWVKGEGKSYEAKMGQVPDVRPFVGKGQCTFTRKRLIDVFIYTQYAHQPDGRRQRQYNECLNEVDGKKGLLAWMFLMEIWRASLQIQSAGRQITSWFNRYCDQHMVAADVVASFRVDNPGIGMEEKEEDRKARLFREKKQELAERLWAQNGYPPSGPGQFLGEAESQLKRVLGC